MTISQKRAIGYSVRKRQYEKDIDMFKKLDLYDDYLFSKYKSPATYKRFSSKYNSLDYDVIKEFLK